MSIKQAWEYVKSDSYRYTRSCSLIAIFRLFVLNPVFRWQLFFRFSKCGFVFTNGFESKRTSFIM